MSADQYIFTIKPILDTIFPIDLNDYKKSSPFMDVKVYGQNAVLRNAGEPDDSLRFIVKGLVGRSIDRKLIQLYFPGQMPFDRESYFSGDPSDVTWLSYGNTVLIEISRSAKEELLEKVPIFKQLFNKLAVKAVQDKREWAKLQRSHYTLAYPLLIKKDPLLLQKLSLIQISSLLGISRKTLSRYLGNTGKKAKKTDGIPSLGFSSRVHPWVTLAHEEVALWLEEMELLNPPYDGAGFRAVKLTWLPGRIFPTITTKKLIAIAKLYALLHLLDQHDANTDKYCSTDQKVGKSLLSNEMLSSSSGLIVALEAFHQIWTREFSPPNLPALKKLLERYLVESSQNKRLSKTLQTPSPPGLGPIGLGLMSLIHNFKPEVFWQIWASLDHQKNLCLQYLSLLDEYFLTGEILHKKSLKKDKADIIIKMEKTAYLYRQEEVRVFRSERDHAIYYLECFDMLRSLMAGTLDWYLSKDKKPD